MISRSPADTAAIAREFASKLEANTKGATVIALSGELGAGKTAFVKAFAASFGIPAEDVTSPTFVIEKRFPIQGRAWKTLVHIDAYRLESATEIERLGWKATLADSSNLVLIEWPEKIGVALPANAIHIEFSHIEGGAEGEREISFK
jgi:tRNA threonylcarbamoyladenosine biosynthesis protein TsaE